MKKIIAICIGLFPMLLFAQINLSEVFPLNDNSQVEYEGTVYLSDSTFDARELFIHAKVWTNNAFYPSTTIIKVDDKETGILMLDSYIVNGTGNYIQDHKIWFTMKLEFRDGRFRYTISGLKSRFIGYYKRYDGPFEEWVPQSFADYIERPMGTKKIEKCYEEYFNFFKSIDSDLMGFIASLERSLNDSSQAGKW